MVENRKMHMIGWSKVMKPKGLGGLGIFQVKARNAAILAKLCWRMASSPNCPWVQMLISKYLTTVRLREGRRSSLLQEFGLPVKKGGLTLTKD